MKPKKFDPASLAGQRILILSDGKPGHVNQAIAFARLLDCKYDVVTVSFRFPGAKALSYLADRCGIYSLRLVNVQSVAGDYAAIVSAGSSTYYGTRCLSRVLGVASVAIMLPKGYRLVFDLIVAQRHDNPPAADNILTIPVNLSCSTPENLVTPQPGYKYLALIIGGDSVHGCLSAENLEKQILQIRQQLPDHRVWITTSRRTSIAVEQMIESQDFDWAVFYSKNQINPIPDFLATCEYVFITADSSSMVSEAVCSGSACIEILPLLEGTGKSSKLHKLIDHLAQLKCLHIFNGQIGKANAKLDLAALLTRSC